MIQNALRKIGIDLTLNVEDQSAYYGRAVFGSSDWLDSEMGIEDYAHRGVPNTILTASLGSRGTFNAAHFKNPEYDRLVASYIAALDPAAQRASAGRIQRLLLEETPVIIAYFYDWLSVTGKHVSGVRPTADGSARSSGTRSRLRHRLARARAGQARPRECGSGSHAPRRQDAAAAPAARRSRRSCAGSACGTRIRTAG